MAQARKGTCRGPVVILITKSPAPDHTLSSLTGPSLAALLLLIALELGIGESIHMRLSSLPPSHLGILSGSWPQGGTMERNQALETLEQVPTFSLNCLVASSFLPTSPGTSGAKRGCDRNMLC